MRRMIGQRTSHGAPVGAASLLALLTGYAFLRRRSEARNADSLRAELGCSPDEARRLLLLARERGFGAAYEAVLGTPPRHTRRRPIPAPSGRGARALRGLRPQRGHAAPQS
jgi:hypothetical protein